MRGRSVLVAVIVTWLVLSYFPGLTLTSLMGKRQG
jgi:hypothetical protein